MAIQAACGTCGKSYALADAAAGKKPKCKSCGGVIAVPAMHQARHPAPAAPQAPHPRQPAARAPAAPQAARAPATQPRIASVGGPACPKCGHEMAYGTTCFQCGHVAGTPVQAASLTTAGAGGSSKMLWWMVGGGVGFLVLIAAIVVVWTLIGALGGGKKPVVSSGSSASAGDATTGGTPGANSAGTTGGSAAASTGGPGSANATTGGTAGSQQPGPTVLTGARRPRYTPPPEGDFEPVQWEAPSNWRGVPLERSTWPAAGEIAQGSFNVKMITGRHAVVEAGSATVLVDMVTGRRSPISPLALMDGAVVSPDGKEVFGKGADGTEIRSINGRLMKEFRAPGSATGTPLPLAFLQDRVVQLVSYGQAREVHMLPLSSAAGSEPKAVRVGEIDDDKLIYAGTERIWAFAILDKMGSKPATVSIVNVWAGEKLGSVTLPARPANLPKGFFYVPWSSTLRGMAISPDGTELAVVFYGEHLRILLLDLRSGRPVADKLVMNNAPPVRTKVVAAQWLPDGSGLVAMERVLVSRSLALAEVFNAPQAGRSPRVMVAGAQKFRVFSPEQDDERGNSYRIETREVAKEVVAQAELRARSGASAEDQRMPPLTLGVKTSAALAQWQGQMPWAVPAGAPGAQAWTPVSLPVTGHARLLLTGSGSTAVVAQAQVVTAYSLANGSKTGSADLAPVLGIDPSYFEAMDVSPSGTRVLVRSGSSGKTRLDVLALNGSTLTPVAAFRPGGGGNVNEVQWAAMIGEDHVLALTSREMSLWPLKDLKAVWISTTPPSNATISPDRRLLAVPSHNGLAIVDIMSGDLCGMLPDVRDAVAGVGFSADGTRLVVLANNQRGSSLSVYDLKKGTLLHDMPCPADGHTWAPLVQCMEGGLVVVRGSYLLSPEKQAVVRIRNTPVTVYGGVRSSGALWVQEPAGLALKKVATPEVETALAASPASKLLAWRPGMTVKLRFEGLNPEETRTVQTAWQAALTRDGFKIDNASPNELVYHTVTRYGPSTTCQMRRMSQGTMETVTITPRAVDAIATLRVGGVEVWKTISHGAMWGNPGFMHVQGRSAQQAVDEYMSKNSRPNLHLPTPPAQVIAKDAAIGEVSL